MNVYSSSQIPALSLPFWVLVWLVRKPFHLDISFSAGFGLLCHKRGRNEAQTRAVERVSERATLSGMLNVSLMISGPSWYPVPSQSLYSFIVLYNLQSPDVLEARRDEAR